MAKKGFSVARGFWRLLRFEDAFALYRRLVLWSFSVARARYATPWILFFSYIEGVFFPVPPDAFLLARGVAKRKGLLPLALAVSVFSVAGGATSYGIGAWLFDSVGETLLGTLGMEHAFERVLDAFSGKVAFWTIALFGFTILPFKVIALACGVASVPLPVFLVAALLSRSARFVGVALLMILFGARLGEWLQGRQAFVISLAVMLLGVLLLVLYAAGVFA